MEAGSCYLFFFLVQTRFSFSVSAPGEDNPLEFSVESGNAPLFINAHYYPEEMEKKKKKNCGSADSFLMFVCVLK